MLDLIISEVYEFLIKKPSNWAFRFNTLWFYRRKENNIFSLCSTLFILQEISPRLSSENLERVVEIRKFIESTYPHYKNKDGRATYNFYRTFPSQHFPRGLFMKYFDHFRLPDDIDDTSLITLTLNKPVSEVRKLKALTETFAENFSNGLCIYSTWYGKNMPKEQDVCAILNFLYLVYYHKLPLNKTDADSILFLIGKVDLITKKPFEIARHYGNPALILYHYARFMSKFSSPLDEVKPKIIEIIHQQLAHEKIFMNQLLLETSLLKFGEERPPINLDTLTFKGFYTFIGAPFAPFDNKLFRKIASKPRFQIFWSSTVHNKALVAEYLSLLC